MNDEKSLAFKAFHEEFFGRSSYLQWHDGVDLTVLKPLRGKERVEVEEMLIEDLLAGGMWAARGLGELRSAKSLPHLKVIAKKGLGSEAIWAAEAIEKIEGTGTFVRVIIDNLSNAGNWGTRINAAMVLRAFPRDDVVEALFTGMLDKDMLVRNHSAESLLAIHGLTPNISKHEDIYRLLVADSSKHGKSAGEQHGEAASMLRALLERGVPIKEK